MIGGTRWWSSWDDVFRRSKIGPNIFAIRREAESDVMAAVRRVPGCAVESRNHLFGYLCWNVAFPGGGILRRDHPYFPSGQQLHGSWLVGTLALRVICEVMEIRLPLRLKEEPEVPDAATIGRILAASGVASDVTRAFLAKLADVYCSPDLASVAETLIDPKPNAERVETYSRDFVIGILRYMDAH